jgi:iron complex transport system substrate-binding protein
MRRLATVVATACLVLAGGGIAVAEGVFDASGQEIRLRTDNPRIVTLSPHATELVVAAGAAGRLVAIASGHAPPPALRHLPRTGGAGPIDRERLLALAPDLVVAWLSGNRRSDLAWIRDAGIALYASEPRRLDDIAQDIRALGRLTGNSETAERTASDFLRLVETPCRALARIPVYVNVWEQPAMTLGGRHWLNDVLRHTGYRNVLADQPLSVMRIGAEDRLRLQTLPRISLQRHFDGSADDRLAELLSRPGPRLSEAASLLCQRRLGEG